MAGALAAACSGLCRLASGLRTGPAGDGFRFSDGDASAAAAAASAAASSSAATAEASHRCGHCRAGIHNDLRRQLAGSGEIGGWRTHGAVGPGEYRFHCAKCKYDECGDCHIARLSPSEACTDNDTAEAQERQATPSS